MSTFKYIASIIGFTLLVLVAMVGLSIFSRRYLGYVEFRASEIQALADLLGISVADLVGDPAKASA